MQAYAITLTKIAPGEPTGLFSDLLEDWGFDSRDDAVRAFNKVPLSAEYPRKELWVKDTVTKVKRILKEERYNG